MGLSFSNSKELITLLTFESIKVLISLKSKTCSLTLTKDFEAMFTLLGPLILYTTDKVVLDGETPSLSPEIKFVGSKDLSLT